MASYMCKAVEKRLEGARRLPILRAVTYVLVLCTSKRYPIPVEVYHDHEIASCRVDVHIGWVLAATRRLVRPLAKLPCLLPFWL